jgi:serine/threonine protein kinase
MCDTSRTIDDYEIGDVISEEVTTVIYEATDRNSGEPVAIKFPKPGCLQIAAEVAALSEVSHGHVISIKAVLDTADGPAIVLPLARGGDLFHWISYYRMSEADLKLLMFNVLQALAHLHRQKMWHRDVKPENMLLMDAGFSPDSVVLSDFGYARRFDDGVCDDEFCGSPHYAAPHTPRRSTFGRSASRCTRASRARCPSTQPTEGR